MRAWRRAPGVCSDGHLCWWTHAATQRASRARRRGSPLAGQLSEAETIDRGHLRTQSLFAASGAALEGAQEDEVIEMRRAQLSFGDGWIAGEVSDLREGWMEHPDRVLADEQIVAAVYEALARQHPKSRSRGRLGAPAEMVWRLLILKHIRNWSYGVLEREVRANLVYRDFTRVGA